MRKWAGLVCLLLAACSKPASVQTVSCADPVAGCRADAGIGVRFSEPPAVMRQFVLEVDAAEGATPYASFQMKDMDMGPNRYRLLRVDGKWRAKVMLPACVRGRHDWMLRLEVGGKVYELPFTAG
jgi:hypothetical protein